MNYKDLWEEQKTRQATKKTNPPLIGIWLIHVAAVNCLPGQVSGEGHRPTPGGANR